MWGQYVPQPRLQLNSEHAPVDCSEIVKEAASTFCTCNSSNLSIGTWSTPGPLNLGSVLQLTTRLAMLALQKMLSGQVQFFVDLASKVGMTLGRTITISLSTTISNRTPASSSTLGV